MNQDNRSGKRNAFKSLDKAVNKGDGRVRPDDRPEEPSLEFRVKEKEGFIYLRPQIFEKISDYPEHDHLKNGIYMAKDLIRFDEEITKIIKDIALPYNKINIRDGEIVDELRWYDAVQLAEHFDSRLMTLAEFFCLVDYERKYKTDKDIVSMMHDGKSEFLHGCIKREFSPDNPMADDNKFVTRLYTKMKKEFHKIGEGTYYDFDPEPIADGNFYLSDIDRRSGLPVQTREDGNMRLFLAGNSIAQNYVPARFKAVDEITEELMPGISLLGANLKMNYVGVRPIKDITDEDIECIK